MSETKSRLKVNFFLVGLLLITIFLGMVGGGVIGGFIGYSVAINPEPEPIVISEPHPVSMNQNTNPPVLQDLSTTNEAFPLSENEALIMAVDLIKPATVTILNFGRSGMSSGSGVIIDAAGYIVTNHHVVEGASNLEVIFSHGGRVTAQLVGSSPDFDLAVIKVDSSHVPAVASLGDSSALRQGERVAAIGSALGDFRDTVTSGVISAHNRSLGGLRSLLQTDTPINHGNSGGPLINLYGEVVGINVMVLRGNTFGGDVAEGLGFAIPSNIVKTVARQLIETGEAQVPFLGVSYADLNPQLSLEKGTSLTTGVFIERVISGTAAARAGLQAGDVILALNGQQIDDHHPFSELLLGHSVGQDVTLTVVRGDQRFEVTVALGERPSQF